MSGEPMFRIMKRQMHMQHNVNKTDKGYSRKEAGKEIPAEMLSAMTALKEQVERVWEHVSVARIAPSLLHLGRRGDTGRKATTEVHCNDESFERGPVDAIPQHVLARAIHNFWCRLHACLEPVATGLVCLITVRCKPYSSGSIRIKRSNGERSGERVGHGTGTPLPIHLRGYSAAAPRALPSRHPGPSNWIFLSAFEAEKHGSDKGDTAPCIKCDIAATSRALNCGVQCSRRAACTCGTFSGDPISLLFAYRGATVVERLAILVQSPAGSLRIFAGGNRAGRCRWSVGFLGDLPFPPTLPFRCCPIRISITLVGSQHLDIKSRPNLLIHSLVRLPFTKALHSGADDIDMPVFLWRGLAFNVLHQVDYRRAFRLRASEFTRSKQMPALGLNVTSPRIAKIRQRGNPVSWSPRQPRYVKSAHMGTPRQMITCTPTCLIRVLCARVNSAPLPRTERCQSYRVSVVLRGRASKLRPCGDGAQKRSRSSRDAACHEVAGETGDPQEVPPANGIVRHDSHTRKSGVTRPGIEPG
ncbi:hypothetical protein PR048_032309 [Dryococelus australis]|uniref:Uncharacterized protein n=1 Tax=Dryococelus australis TaxID=614101 RepID=A0ABQ9G1V3_9NEOP|nr:hypothetical protein PR048_032309 [Dryococelus australis]